jgi:hypothetical protein
MNRSEDASFFEFEAENSDAKGNESKGQIEAVPCGCTE